MKDPLPHIAVPARTLPPDAPLKDGLNEIERLAQRDTEPSDPKRIAGDKKVPLALIPPVAREEAAWVHALGAGKYGAWNWRTTGVSTMTYAHAILRHLNAWRDGEDLDPESGHSHIAHILCCCNILLDAKACGKLTDDRSKMERPETEDSIRRFAETLQPW